jgi:alpha,alpha-trehalase
MSDSGKYLPIREYSLIGDCHTAALISSGGSIDWYCPGRFDNPAVFCRILDANKGGFLEIAPTESCSTSRKYVENSNILTSVLISDNSKLVVKQFMPIRSEEPGGMAKDVTAMFKIVSLVEARTDTEIRVRFKPTFNFAKNQSHFERCPGAVVASWLGNYLTLWCRDMEFSLNDNGVAEGILRISQEEKRWIVLDYKENEKDVQISFSDEECNTWLNDTQEYWQKWTGKCSYHGPYRNEVLRCALALKLLTYEPSGAVIGAPTTSLPEEIGGERNWDYRYSWLRDSALILYALMTVGYRNEATDFFKWLQLTQKKDPKRIPQIMYKIDGGDSIREATLDNLEGYKKSSPVRIGNAAASQFQLDIFGEVMISANLHYLHNEDDETKESWAEKRADCSDIWPILKQLVNEAAQKWRQPDSGIWEIRGELREFLYSRLMCWAALDRGVILARKFDLPAPINSWQDARDEIRSAILSKGYNSTEKAFTQSFGSKALDASALIIPRIGFLPGTDRRVISTIKSIEEKLTNNGYVYRYLTEDGLPGREATFGLCTFWQIDALALGGRQEAAQDLFEKMISSANDVGLLSEELDTKSGAFLGNFPQGISHSGLIGSAVNLSKIAKHGPEEAMENEAQRAGRARDAAREGATGSPRT